MRCQLSLITYENKAHFIALSENAFETSLHRAYMAKILVSPISVSPFISDPTPVLIWDYISQRLYINRQITIPLLESNLSAELCLKNKKPSQTVCAHGYTEPDAVFSSEWLRLRQSYIDGCFPSSWWLWVLMPCFTIPLCKCPGWQLLRKHSGRFECI